MRRLSPVFPLVPSSRTLCSRILSSMALPAMVVALLAPALPAAAQAESCVFTISMVSGTDVNNLDYTVNYVGAPGEVSGSGSKAECVNALGGTGFAVFNDDDQGHMKVAMARLTYFSGPVTIAGCRFLYDSLEPAPADFAVTVTNAGRDGSDVLISPLPVVQVTTVECPGEMPTTTTTLPPSGRCGFPVSDGDKPTASDALRALRVAVGNGECATCVCDVNNSGSVTTADALAILRAAVGSSTALNCPPC